MSKTVVLIVEDEPLIRMDVADFVADSGMDAVEAGNADEALRILEGRSDVNVVFTDVNMPGSMDGMQLAALINERWPQVAVIITSGMVRPSKRELVPSAVFYEKPYSFDKLVTTIRSLAA